MQALLRRSSYSPHSAQIDRPLSATRALVRAQRGRSKRPTDCSPGCGLEFGVDCSDEDGNHSAYLKGDDKVNVGDSVLILTEDGGYDSCLLATIEALYEREGEKHALVRW